MLIFPHSFQKIKAVLTLDRIYDIFVLLVMGLIFLMVCIGLSRPVATHQYQNILILSKQAVHPKTQKMALELLQTEKIQRIYYLKLMRAYQFEQTQVKHYPAQAAEDLH